MHRRFSGDDEQRKHNTYEPANVYQREFFPPFHSMIPILRHCKVVLNEFWTYMPTNARLAFKVIPFHYLVPEHVPASAASSVAAPVIAADDNSIPPIRTCRRAAPPAPIRSWSGSALAPGLPVLCTRHR